ncbi:MAG: hypothetical protein KDC98_05180, partial [Planctomycetes bacterium]|nr:hypothetical protein [Planctomycetota bacterium]
NMLDSCAPSMPTRSHDGGAGVVRQGCSSKIAGQFTLASLPADIAGKPLHGGLHDAGPLGKTA